MPSDEEMLRITLARVPAPTGEDDPPRRAHRARARRGHRVRVGLRALADMLAQPMPGPLGGADARRLRSQYGDDVDRPPALPPTQAPRTPWNQAITPHRRFAYTTIPLEDAKTVRRAFGCTFNDVVMALCSGTLRALPAAARLPARGEPHRDGAGQRAQRQRERHLPEPRVGAARRPGHQRDRPGEAAAPRAAEHDRGQGATSRRSPPRRCRTSPSSLRRRSPPGRCACTAGCGSPTG